MTLWELRALDVLAAVLAVSGMTVIIRALLACHVSVRKSRVTSPVGCVARALRPSIPSAPPRSRLHAGSTSPA